jgi:hypothetical protein
VIVSDVEWVRDRRHRPVLRLCIDGQLAHIPSGQQVELTRRGLVKGVDVLVSDWRRHQTRHPFIRDDLEPGLAEADLMGCTDDPRVVALYQEMCRAIAADAWRPGLRPLPA